MSKWSREGNWEMLRAAVTTTREEQIRNLYMQIAEMNKAIAERGDKYATSTEPTPSTSCPPPSPKWKGTTA